MVELQIVILAVAGSSPVGHPTSRVSFPQRPQTAFSFMARAVLNENGVKTLPAEPEAICESGTDFWQRLLNDSSLQGYDDLEKLLAGCEIIAALDDLGLLAA